MAEPTLQDLIRQAAEKQQIEAGEKIVETQIKILTVSYDRAAAYNNVIIIAGYAAFFGLWSVTKVYLSKGQAMWAALLACISLATFVFFQVYQMALVSHRLHNRYLVLYDKLKGKSAQIVLAELKALEESSKRELLRFLPAWRIHLLIAVSTGMSAFLVLAYAYIAALLSGAA
jgi:hypothetical protein